MDTLRDYIVSYFASIEQAALRLVHGAADVTVLPFVHTLGQHPQVIVIALVAVFLAALLK